MGIKERQWKLFKVVGLWAEFGYRRLLKRKPIYARNLNVWWGCILISCHKYRCSKLSVNSRKPWPTIILLHALFSHEVTERCQWGSVTDTWHQMWRKCIIPVLSRQRPGRSRHNLAHLSCFRASLFHCVPSHCVCTTHISTFRSYRSHSIRNDLCHGDFQIKILHEFYISQGRDTYPLIIILCEDYRFFFSFSSSQYFFWCFLDFLQRFVLRCH